MDKIYDKLILYLEEENKEKVLNLCLNALENNEIDVVDMYSEILSRAMYYMNCNFEEKTLCIWKEHVRTAIIRSVIECSYPYIVKKKKELNYSEKGTVVTICPPEEYHDLGARMTADFFTICGYKSVFVGSATPYEDFYNVVHVIRPDIIAISVSNFYNLVSTKRIISELKKKTVQKALIVVGGYVFDKNPDNVEKVGADMYVKTFTDIENICRNGVDL